MVVWAEEEVVEVACRPRSVSDFCVRYEYVQRKASEDALVSPHAYPTHLEDPHPQFGSPVVSPVAYRDQYCMQDRRFGSPVGSPIAYQDMDMPQTPQFRDRLNTQDGDEFPQEATEWSTTTTPYPCYPYMWFPVSGADQQHQAEQEHYDQTGQQPVQTQQQVAAPMLYYCVGFVNAESMTTTTQPQADYAGGRQQESPESSYWTGAEPSQPSKARSKRNETPPKVLQAGQVHRDASKGSEPLVKDEERTTIMLRNIPKDITREKMMDLLNTLGYAKMYDFLYLPRDFKDNFAIYGYAFVNFANHEEASKALELFNGFVDWQSTETNIVPCEAHWGHPLQGYDAHVERYRNSPVMSSQVPDMCRPVVLQDGLPVSFPAPTKPIRLPRRKGWILTGKRAEQARSA